MEWGPLLVIAGLDPAIHGEFERGLLISSLPRLISMDTRVTPAHDE
jgi:hypothetical protein